VSAQPSAPFRAALIQMRTGLSPEASFDQAAALIRQASADGAVYVQTPEMSNLMQENRTALFSLLKDESEDRSLAGYRALARELGIHVHVGSLAVRASPERAANRSFVIDPAGEIVARYDKIHMFDVDLGSGETYRESANYQPGESAILADLPFGRLGLSICYDLRFPALYRALAEAGAGFIAIPSAFTRKTGEAHWHILMRARAIETGCFVLAAAQGGRHENGRETFGHSVIIDPWGTILAEGGTEPGIVMATIDPAKVASVRKSIPSLDHGRRFTLADPQGGPAHLHVVRSTT
jgi:predicted amidohydrolase